MTRITGALALLIWMMPAARAAATDLKVTDSRGREVVVAGAAIDYGGFMTDRETSGIRLLQGDGMVTAKWTEIDTLTVTKTDTSVKPPRVEMEVLLRNGRKVPVELFRQGQMKIVGRTELGDYSIDLDKVRAIAPVR